MRKNLLKLKLFPHFLRKIAAPFFLITLLGLIILNLLQPQLFASTIEKKIQASLLKEPTKSSLHEELARVYLPLNSQAAEREYLLASEEKILGLSSSPWQTWLVAKRQQEKARQELAFWQEARKVLPHYQYATFKLASLFYQLGEREKTREYLVELLKENPTEETILNLREKVR